MRAHDVDAAELEVLLSRDVDVRRVSYLPAAFRGYTLSTDTVLLRPDADYATLAHELAHTDQMEHDGAVAFAVKYAAEWYAGLWQGCSIADARRAVSYEIAAEAVARDAEHRYMDVALWQAWREDVKLPEYVLALEKYHAVVEKAWAANGARSGVAGYDDGAAARAASGVPEDGASEGVPAGPKAGSWRVLDAELTAK